MAAIFGHSIATRASGSAGFSAYDNLADLDYNPEETDDPMSISRGDKRGTMSIASTSRARRRSRGGKRVVVDGLATGLLKVVGAVNYGHDELSRLADTINHEVNLLVHPKSQGMTFTEQNCYDACDFLVAKPLTIQFG